MNKIENNYKNLNWYSEQLSRLAVEYKAHAGKNTFIDNTLTLGNVKHLRQLSRLLNKMAKDIENNIGKDD